MSYMYRSDLACLTVCGGRGLTFHGSSCSGKLCSQSSLWCQFLSPASLACLLSYCFVSMDQGSLRKGVNTWEGSEVQKRLEFIRNHPDCSGNLEWVCVESSFGGGCAPPFFMQCLFLCLAFGYGRVSAVQRQWALEEDSLTCQVSKCLLAGRIKMSLCVVYR